MIIWKKNKFSTYISEDAFKQLPFDDQRAVRGKNERLRIALQRAEHLQSQLSTNKQVLLETEENSRHLQQQLFDKINTAAWGDAFYQGVLDRSHQDKRNAEQVAKQTALEKDNIENELENLKQEIAAIRSQDDSSKGQGRHRDDLRPVIIDGNA